MLFRFVVMAILCLPLWACTGDKENVTAEAPLTVGVMPSLDYLPLAVAQREGYFAKHNLSVVLQKFYSANERDAAFQAGSIDGTVIDYTGAILQKAGGVKLALTSRCDAPFFLVAGQKTGAQKVSDIAGHTVAVSQNTVIDYVLDMALAAAGLTGNDVQKLEINKIPLRFEMLRSGKIDATGLPNPFAMMAEKAGDSVLVSNQDMGLSITGIMFSEQAVKNKAKKITALYAAYTMGAEYLAAHPVSAVKEILVTQFGYPPEVAENAVLPIYGPASLPDTKSLLSVAKWLEGRGLIAPGFDVEGLVNGAFIGQ